MILRSFKSVAWVAGVGAAALSCYMLSLKVAAERAELAGVESRIVATQRAIRDLQTELGTRGRLQQLENWNAEVLALSAPAAGQYVENELLLARFETRDTPAAVEAPVRMASAETAPQQAPHAEAPAAVQRAVAPATPARAPSQPAIRRASLTTAPAAPVRAERPKPAPAPTTTASAAPRTPSRASSLLDERTAREIGEAARAERRRPAATPARDRQSPQD